MKKVILSLFAVAALASCVQTEELGVANNKEAIGFDTFVDNATKASAYDNSNLTSFKVYGTISKNGAVVTNIFDDVTVTKNGSAWTYRPEHTQYWIPGFHYDFAAVVDGTVVKNSNNMPESIEVNMENQEDILYAKVEKHFGANDTAEKVSFQFAHLLSKAKFTVKNAISKGSDFVYNVESIIIKNADKDAEYNVARSEWTATNTYEADFGVATSLIKGASAVSNDVLLVPGTKELAIAIEYNLTYTNPAGNEATLVDTTKNLTAVLTLEQGKAYNFIVEFGKPGEEIDFDAVVDGWENGGNNGEVVPNENIVVTTAEQLAEVVNGATEDIVVELANDLQGAITLNKNSNPDVDVLILGNNKTFAGKIHIWGAGGATSTMTIKGVNFVVDGSYTGDEACIYTLGNINGTNSYARNVTIDGCTFSGTGETVAAIRHNVGGTNDWTIKNCTVNAGMHSFLQIANVNSGLVVENCKAYSKNGVNLNQTHGATFTGCEFDVKGYAVRVGVNQDNDSYNNEQFTFTNCDFKSQCDGGDAVVVVRGTAQDATLNFVECVVEGTTRIGGAVAGKTKVYFDGVEWVPGGYSVDANGNYHIYSAEGWLAVANEPANKFSFKTIYLENDINFAGINNIKPIVFRVWDARTTFDGKNHTVSNIFMSANYGKDNQALFDGLITVKNLNVVDTHVYGMSRVGIIGAQLYGDIENCHVKRSRAYGYVYQIGGIVGLQSDGFIKDCSIEDSTIECYYYGGAGAIAGCLNEDIDGKITGCSVKNCSLIKEGPLGVYPEYDTLFGVLVGDVWVARNFEFSCDIENVTILGTPSSQLCGSLPSGSTVTFNGVQQ